MRIHRDRLDPGPPVLAEVRTAYGPAVARWRGDLADAPGRYRVEWTIDEERAAVRTVSGVGPGIRCEGQLLVLRGEFDGEAVPRVGGAIVLLDLPGRPPGPLELAVPREHVELYPCRT
ncbi:hypothetical protein TR51_15985 [Kitasatospora griseola]|uniref:Uncharacterized protein n=1 Tax=Kitasatospora griseola TaxID=2064 RepID=A0A0D0PYJ1_KITGR|nr:hypothetical protein [Kitasatospora griseola]KIQ65402.1 hypothetical protein TR51_15985 [Kitasatospora griseola]